MVKNAYQMGNHWNATAICAYVLLAVFTAVDLLFVPSQWLNFKWTTRYQEFEPPYVFVVPTSYDDQMRPIWHFVSPP